MAQDEAAASRDDPTQANEPLPSRFGPYRIRREIGRGATGVVYEAVDDAEGRVVALKVLRAALTADVRTTQRFAREARTAGALKHPNIVVVYDSGEIEGRLFVAMEWIRGPSLAELLGEIRAKGGAKPSPVWLDVLDASGVPSVERPAASPAAVYGARVAALFAPVAEALGALWDAGFVHRDVKPQNLVLGADGCLKLTDFGLAKVRGDDLTSSSTTLGTVAYMSPEQARGQSREVDGRTDVYGLGATLYDALTLHAPVEAAGAVEALGAILHSTPPTVLTRCPAYGSRLSTVVAKCLEKEPGDRYESGHALAADLARLAGGERPQARPVSTGRRLSRFIRARPRATLYTALLTVVGLALLTFWALRPAEIHVTSYPRAALELDGGPRGEVPWSGQVTSGPHVIRLTLDGFEEHLRHLDLEAGQTWSEEVALRPRRDDPEALTRLMASLGMRASFPATAPPKARAGSVVPLSLLPWEDLVFVVGPRGDVSRELRRLRVFTALPLRVAVHLRPLDADAEPIYEIRLSAGRADAREQVAELPDDVAAALAAEDVFQVELRGGDGDRSVSRATFRVTERPGPRALLSALPERERAKPHVRLAAATQLLGSGLAAESYELVRSVLDDEPTNPLALRLALAALYELGLLDCPLYGELRERYALLEDEE